MSLMWFFKINLHYNDHLQEVANSMQSSEKEGESQP